jgi:hypothetical protein
LIEYGYPVDDRDELTEHQFAQSGLKQTQYLIETILSFNRRVQRQSNERLSDLTKKQDASFRRVNRQLKEQKARTESIIVQNANIARQLDSLEKLMHHMKRSGPLPPEQKPRDSAADSIGVSPMVTVITVVYNAVDHIQQTIDSVAEQSYSNVEYIVIDGASSDGTSATLKANEAHIDQLVIEHDDGIYDAMNKGLALASGFYVNFMNAGDTFASATVLNEIFEGRTEFPDVIYGDRFYVHKDGRKELREANQPESMFSRMPFGHQAAFVKLDLLREAPFNTTYRYAADYELFVRLFKQNRSFLHAPLPVCNFLEGGRSESGIRPHLEVLKILFDNCEDRDLIRESAYFQSFVKGFKKLSNI